MNFIIRAKTPADMIAIKDELNEQGIVPLGRFELVEDIVRLNKQTTEQTGSASYDYRTFVCRYGYCYLPYHRCYEKKRICDL